MTDRHKNHGDERAFTHGSSGATADMASDPKKASDSRKALEEQRAVDAPDTRPAERLKESEKHDQLAERAAETKDRQEAILDEAIEETFPGSDPIAPKHIT